MKGNVLGDVRAEQDTKMLESAFWESSDYKALLESCDRPIVVGRRGTGKSALANKLSKYWGVKPRHRVITIAPEEEQVIGLRDIFDLFGDKYLHIKAGTKMAWRYAIYMEVVSDIASHYKLQKSLDISPIREHVQEWGAKRKGLASKIRNKMKSVLKDSSTPQSRIADLSDALELDLIEEVLVEALVNANITYAVFADKLDEGYSPDNLGVAIVDGFVQAVIDIKNKVDEKIVAFAFVRDNIYRAISKLDPDFTRNIEGQTHRLHWDEYNLFNMVCNRIRIAFGSDVENNTRLWNKYAAKDLKGAEGFRCALKLTLYRPRDILVLLNEAFLRANSRGRSEIILEDIEATAKFISINRLADLHKEYEYIFPSLEEFTSVFNGSPSELTISLAASRVEGVLEREDYAKDKQQDIFIIGTAGEVLQRLYSVGFLGLYNDGSTSFVFCHDGKDPDRDFNDDARVLIHPCYWLALSTTQSELKLDEAEDINDEYDIEVTSISKEQRNQKIGSLLNEMDLIPEGSQGAYDFEAWCLKAVKIIFAGTLCNVELHPNKNSLQQRDIVGTNLGGSNFWRRVLEDYKSRQVVFEVKNYQDMTADVYRQVSSYLCNEYGTIGFILTRDNNNNLSKHREMEWARELYFNHNKLVIKVSFKFLQKHLRKLRSPQKHDAADKELSSLIDTYLRQYFSSKAR